MEQHIPVVRQWAGAFDGNDTLVREYANGDLTICTRPTGGFGGWGPEVDLAAEVLTGVTC